MSGRSQRSGFSLLELVVSCILLSVAMGAVVPVMAWVGMQRRAADQHQFALQEAANILERMTLADWNELTPETAEAVELPDQARGYLTDAELTVSVADAAGSPPAKRIRVELRWRSRSGEMTAPVRLTAWVYQHEETK